MLGPGSSLPSCGADCSVPPPCAEEAPSSDAAFSSACGNRSASADSGALDDASSPAETDSLSSSSSRSTRSAVPNRRASSPAAKCRFHSSGSSPNPPCRPMRTICARQVNQLALADNAAKDTRAPPRQPCSALVPAQQPPRAPSAPRRAAARAPRAGPRAPRARRRLCRGACSRLVCRARSRL